MYFVRVQRRESSVVDYIYGIKLFSIVYLRIIWSITLLVLYVTTKQFIKLYKLINFMTEAL